MKIKDKMATKEPIEILIDMNNSMRSPSAGVNVCIYNCFNHTADQRKERCEEFKGCCLNCIAALMNEDVKLWQD